jgi:cytochrome c-type biogenesis protein CcmH
MVFWLFSAALTGFTIFVLLWPLAQGDGAVRDRDDRDFYDGQIRDIDRDLERGFIDAEAAEEAKVEAARRLLAASSETHDKPVADHGRRRKLASLITLIVMPLLALGLYGYVGSPDQPDQPLVARQAEREGATELSALITKVEARLNDHPEDGMGWATIAPVYVSSGRYDDAMKAFDNALRILGENAELRSGLGEARMAAADGIVTAEALSEFDKALALDPTNARARYYRALAAEQDGQIGEAISRYKALLQSLSPQSQEATFISERIAKLSGQAQPVAQSINPDQLAMIRGMVEGLDAKLQQDGSDLEGWMRLIKSYVVLGDKDKATDALRRAHRAKSNDPSALRQLTAEASSLGLSEDPQ